MLHQISNDFFCLSESDGVFNIKICTNYLNFEQLSQCRELRDIAPNRTFCITGKSSIEAYFCLGFLLTHWRAASINGIGASGEKTLHIDNLLNNPPVSPKKWLECKVEDGCIIADVLRANSQSGKWSAEDLELEIPSKLPESAKKSMHLTGQGSVWMYMQLGISAALAGIQDVYISKPVLPYEIHINAEGICEAHTVKKDSKQGVVVGILGDPNSGKSVFSRNFAIMIQKLMPSWFAPWIYDCDLASPSPEWYLNDCEGTKEVRNAIKRKWTPELEGKVVADLKVLRQNLDLTLADMPGGRKIDEQTLIRIPSPSRGAMMAECDVFIVLCRQDRQDKIFANWRHALADYQLENRIIARIVSANPNDECKIEPLQIDHDGLFSTTINGLSRDNNRAQIVQTMKEGLEPFVKYLSYIRIAREAQVACEQAVSKEILGIRYGVVARNAQSGKIFSIGKNSSIHDTTKFGEVDVDVLAIASSEQEKAISFGVCRQIIKEYALRNSRDYDVILVNSGIHFKVIKLSELLANS